MTYTVYLLIFAQPILIGLICFLLDHPAVRAMADPKGFRFWVVLPMILVVGACIILVFFDIYLLAEQLERVLLQSSFLRFIVGNAMALGICFLSKKAAVSMLKRFGLIR